MLGYSDGIRTSDRKLHCETVALSEGLRGSISHVRRWSGRLGRCQDSEALESSSESGSEPEAEMSGPSHSLEGSPGAFGPWSHVQTLSGSTLEIGCAITAEGIMIIINHGPER
jgi:hypothetical protein